MERRRKFSQTNAAKLLTSTNSGQSWLHEKGWFYPPAPPLFPPFPTDLFVQASVPRQCCSHSIFVCFCLISSLQFSKPGVFTFLILALIIHYVYYRFMALHDINLIFIIMHFFNEIIASENKIIHYSYSHILLKLSTPLKLTERWARVSWHFWRKSVSVRDRLKKITYKVT